MLTIKISINFILIILSEHSKRQKRVSLHLYSSPVKMHREIEPFVGSFGAIFVKDSEKSKKDLRKYVLDVTTKDIRDRIEAPAAQHFEEAHAAKLLSSLYHAGPSSELVQHRLKLSMREIDDPSLVSLSPPKDLSMQSTYKYEPSVVSSFVHPPEKLAPHSMKGSSAILLNDHRRNQPYFVPAVFQQPYQEKLEAKLGDGSQFFTTPKMWPTTSMYPTSPKKDRFIGSEFDASLPPKKNLSSQSLRIKKSDASGGRLLMSPLPSDNPCSRTASPTMNKPTRQIASSSHVNNGKKHKKNSSISNKSISSRDSSEHSLVQGWPSVSTVLSQYQRSVTMSTEKLSGLQDALVQCGHLKVIYDRAEQQFDSSIDRSLEKQKRLIGHHAQWLHGDESLDIHGHGEHHHHHSTISNSSASDIHGSMGPSSHKDNISTHKRQSQTRPTPSSNVHTSTSTSTSSNHSQFRHGSASVLGSNSAVSTGADSKSSSTISINCHNAGGGYMSEISNYMGAVNMSALEKNPYRKARNRPSLINKAIAPTGDDPTMYRQGTRIEHRGSFTVCLNTGVMGVGGSYVPSREEITASLTTVCKKAMLRYDMKIVETGGLLKVQRKQSY